MQILKDRIRKDGKIKAGNVLKVDSFLNHQMDIRLFGEIGKEFKRRFADSEVTKILTIEAVSYTHLDGKRYGSELLAQEFTGENYMWGRIMNVDTATFTGEDGEPLLYSWASNKSPAGEELEALVAERVERLRAANPEQGDEPIPVDLVTCSGSGLDPVSYTHLPDRHRQQRRFPVRQHRDHRPGHGPGDVKGHLQGHGVAEHHGGKPAESDQNPGGQAGYQ